MAKKNSKAESNEALVKELQSLQEDATRDLAYSPRETRPAHEIAKREAQEALPAARKAYADALTRGLAGIFVSGPADAVAAFAASAARLGGTLTVAADAFYRRLTLEVDSGMRQDRQLLPAHFGRLLFAFSQEVRSLDDSHEVPDLKFGDGHVLPSTEDLFEYIRDRVRTDAGDGLNARFIFRDIVDAAISEAYSALVVPVVVTGIGPGEASGLKTLFRDRTVEVTLESVEDVTDELVTSAFKDLRAQLKQHRPN